MWKKEPAQKLPTFFPSLPLSSRLVICQIFKYILKDFVCLYTVTIFLIYFTNFVWLWQKKALLGFNILQCKIMKKKQKSYYELPQAGEGKKWRIIYSNI